MEHLQEAWLATGAALDLGNPGNPNKVIMDIYGYFTKKNAVMREIGAQYVIISTHHERNGIGID